MCNPAITVWKQRMCVLVPFPEQNVRMTVLIMNNNVFPSMGFYDRNFERSNTVTANGLRLRRSELRWLVALWKDNDRITKNHNLSAKSFGSSRAARKFNSKAACKWMLEAIPCNIKNASLNSEAWYREEEMISTTGTTPSGFFLARSSGNFDPNHVRINVEKDGGIKMPQRRLHALNRHIVSIATTG